MKIWNFVITGGPCAGKTSALKLLKQVFEERNFKVIIIQETATEIILSGINNVDVPIKEFQRIVFNRSLLKENTTKNVLKYYNKDVVVFYDRGLLDGKAYMEEKEYKELLEENKITENKILERYDAIFHLVSTACGKENDYTLENNEARTEGIIEAQKIDKRTREVWENHPNLKIIENCAEFDEKMRVLMEKIFEIMKIN